MKDFIATVRERNLGDIYLLVSLLVSGLLWGAFYFSIDSFFDQSFFASSLFICNLYFFYWGFGSHQGVQSGAFFPSLFLSQMICLIGLGYSQDVTGALYLAIIPALCASLFVLDKNGRGKEGVVRSSLPFMIGLFCYALFAQKKMFLLGTSESMVFITFALWSMGMMTWATESLKKQHRSHIFSMVKKHHKQHNRVNTALDEQLRDRYFFHDIINHTHAWRLMLTHKISSNEGLSAEECRSLLQEVKILQEHTQGHFGFGHKDIVGSLGSVSFTEVQDGLVKLVKNFLPPQRAKVDIHFLGDLSQDLPEARRREVRVNLPLVSRILINLIKNTSEHKSKEVDLTFNAQSEGITIILKNKRVGIGQYGDDLSRSLEGLILADDNSWSNGENDKGVGLDSVGTLCEEAGGNFKFSLEGEYWISRVFLPLDFKGQSKKAA